MDITFTLQSGFSGTQADNFNISGVTSSGTNTLLASGVTKSQLLGGHTIDVDPTITGGTITSTGLCTNSVQWYTFGAAPTPTPTPILYTEFTGSGRGSDEATACTDASNNRTFYSDCDGGSFGVGCYVYIDQVPNALTGYNNVFMNGATWDISSVTGLVTAYSSEQC
jgi:hypothetical protein